MASAAPDYTSSSSNNNNRLDDDDDVPEYVPLCELRRRREAEAMTRLKAAQIREAQQAPKFKPLLFNKPSFTFGEAEKRGSSTDSVMSASSGGQQSAGSRKRKSDSDLGREGEPITSYCGLNGVLTRPLSGAVSLSTSAASSLPLNSMGVTAEYTVSSSSGGELRSSSSIYSYGMCPQYRRQWTKDEVDGLVNFAKKWITPDMKRRRMR